MFNIDGCVDLPPEPVFYDDFSFLISGAEKCPETGRFHWQGYLETKKRKTLSFFKHLPDVYFQKAHFTICLADSEKNIKYCSKEGGTIVRFGEPMVQGGRSDLRKLACAVHSGVTTVDEIVVENPHAYHVYGRTLSKLEQLHNRTLVRDKNMTVYWFWGRAGCGKTHKAFELFKQKGGADNLYIAPSMENWWCNYVGQRNLLIDDINPKFWDFKLLLRILDCNPFTVKRKGECDYPMLANFIIITSDVHPTKFYDWAKDYPNDSQTQLEQKIEQLTRRIKLICEFDVPPSGVLVAKPVELKAADLDVFLQNE